MRRTYSSFRLAPSLLTTITCACVLMLFRSLENGRPYILKKSMAGSYGMALNESVIPLFVVLVFGRFFRNGVSILYYQHALIAGFQTIRDFKSTLLKSIPIGNV
ncbi:hypothetical protein F4678DRAFT_340246 [Xylaria arbuscula]|nr:hypothetical protein F4678DRAFT_340246 [Xylaria arbuscula]